MQTEIRSYTSLEHETAGTFREFLQLFRKSVQAKQRVKEEVAYVLDICRRAETLVVEQTSRPIEKLQALEIGPGQLPRQTSYFALKNEVTAIDLDVIPTGLDI